MKPHAPTATEPVLSPRPHASRSKTPVAVTRSFVWSLALLVTALVAFLGVVSLHNGSSEVPTITTRLRDDANAALEASRRRHMREAPLLFKAPAEMPIAAVAAGVKARGAASAGAARSGMFEGIPQGPGDPEIQRAIDLIDAGQPEQAVLVLQEILKKDPRNESALVELAMIHLLDLKQPDLALGYLKNVMDVNPQNQVVLSELVSLYEDQGRLEEGLQFLMDVNAKNPDAPDLSYGIGQMLSMQGRDNEALPYLERATQSADNSVRAYRDLAEAYSRTGDLDRAIGSYDKAIESQEKDISEKMARGMPIAFAEERLNYTKMDKARELLRKGDVDGAQALVDDVSRSMPGDEAVTALQDQVNQKRAG